jgi:hypothetical protein
MAKKDSGNISQNFLTQLLFALILTIIFSTSGINLGWSIFLGLLGGLFVALISSTSRNSTQPSNVDSSDGIDAGLKYWLFFLFGFSTLGYEPPKNILLSGLAGFAGGWIIAWWGSKEDTRTQLQPPQVTEDSEDAEVELPTNIVGRRKMRKVTRRTRQNPDNGLFGFLRR